MLSGRSEFLVDTPARLGTKFLVYPQPNFIPGYEQPEIVWLSSPLGQVLAGPTDRRAYTVDPRVPKEPYADYWVPPFPGFAHPPAEPGPNGHFDHLIPGTRPFAAAHAFACVRRVQDIVESYLGRELPWFFAATHERLEIVAQIDWDNAHAGYGFMELGQDESLETWLPFALNFDVIAHETSHLVLVSALGAPWRDPVTQDFSAYNEAVADFLALVCLLHFDRALDHILRRTRGDLLVSNELDRLSELADEKPVRTMSHSLKLKDVGGDPHDRSRPFSAALFDSLIEIFQILLFNRGLSELDVQDPVPLRTRIADPEFSFQRARTRTHYGTRHYAMKSALVEARDLMGEALVGSWRLLAPNRLTLADAAQAFLTSAGQGRCRPYVHRCYDNFQWRQIL